MTSNFAVVYDDYNELEAKKTLDMGAYLYLKKPFDENLVKYLWQFVWRKRILKEKAKEGSIADNDMGGENEEQFEKKKDVSKTEVVRRKDYTKWTNNLHVKFMKAVKQLEKGRKSTLLSIKYLDNSFI